MRGGVLDHPRYAGRRVFGSGINLTHLYHGRIAFLFFVVRDLGYVNKIYRGLSDAEPAPDREAVDRRGRDLRDRRRLPAAARDGPRDRRARLPPLPAGAQGGDHPRRLEPAPAALRRRAAARQAILSGREFEAGRADAELICDEVVEPGEMDAALDARVEALTSSGLVNAAANRRAMRVGQEPLDLFRAYMATYAREQALLPPQPGAGRQPRDATGMPTSAALSRRDLGRRRGAAARGARGAAARAPARDRRARAGPRQPRRRRAAARGRRDRRRGHRLARRPARGAVHDQGRPARALSRSGCSPSRASELVRVHASSGTGGKPTVVGYTRARPRRPGPR